MLLHGNINISLILDFEGTGLSFNCIDAYQAESHLQDANLTDHLGKSFTSNMHGFARDLHGNVNILLCAYPLSIEINECL